MTVADGSTVRLAYVAEATIGTTPTTPTFQILRYVTADLRPSKQTDIPPEVRPDGNVTTITDVGRSAGGNINGQLSYGTYDILLSSLFRKDWATNVLVNGVSHIAMTIEEFHELGATDNWIRHRGCRVNTLDLNLEARKPVEANFGIMGLGSTVATSAIAGATYTAATTTEIFNAGLNVSALTFTGIATAPKIQKMALKLNSNIYANDIVSAYEPYSHGLGQFVATGSITALYEDKATFDAILNHTTVALGFTLTDAAGNSYAVSIPKTKLLDGGPVKPGNSKAVTIEAPFQAFFDSGIGGSVQITRTPA